MAGRDVLRQEFCRLPESRVRETLVDFGYLENGVLRGTNWLKGVLFDSVRSSGLSSAFIMPQQLEVPEDVYSHFLAIAQHDHTALDMIRHFPLDSVYAVPFELNDCFDLDEFCALGYAVACGNLAYVNAAGESGVVQFSNCKSYHQLGLAHLATRFGHCGMLRAVLAHGCDMNVADEFGFTPIETAVALEKSDQIDCLLSHGADPNLGIDRGSTEVEHAVSLNAMSVRTYHRLKQSGARFDLLDDEQSSPLHFNAQRFRRDTFIAMVRDGLNPRVENREGQTPFDKLRENVPLEIFHQVYEEVRG